MPRTRNGPDGATASTGVSPAVLRAGAILDLLGSNARQPMTLSEITRELDLPKTSTLHILRALRDQRLVRAVGSGYQLGRRCVQLGSAYIEGVDQVRHFHEACASLPPEFTATAQLSVLDSAFNVVFLASHEGKDPLRLGTASQVGRVVPANCSGAGKALLASLPPRDFEERLARKGQLDRLTERSIVEHDALRQELRLIRDRGYSRDDEEVLPGIVCISSAVHSSPGEDVHAVSITKRGQAGADLEGELGGILQTFVANLDAML
jgi:IclR family transcriptional regulator, blcABC operon repressor